MLKRYFLLWWMLTGALTGAVAELAWVASSGAPKTMFSPLTLTSGLSSASVVIPLGTLVFGLEAALLGALSFGVWMKKGDFWLRTLGVMCGTMISAFCFWGYAHAHTAPTLAGALPSTVRYFVCAIPLVGWSLLLILSACFSEPPRPVTQLQPPSERNTLPIS